MPNDAANCLSGNPLKAELHQGALLQYDQGSRGIVGGVLRRFIPVCAGGATQ